MILDGEIIRFNRNGHNPDIESFGTWERNLLVARLTQKDRCRLIGSEGNVMFDGSFGLLSSCIRKGMFELTGELKS